jgi:hypothetical protein
MRGLNWFLEPNPNATAKSKFPISPPLLGIERNRERPWSVVMAKLPAAPDLFLSWFIARCSLPAGRFR